MTKHDRQETCFSLQIVKYNCTHCFASLQVNRQTTSNQHLLQITIMFNWWLVGLLMLCQPSYLIGRWKLRCLPKLWNDFNKYKESWIDTSDIDCRKLGARIWQITSSNTKLWSYNHVSVMHRYQRLPHDKISCTYNTKMKPVMK